MILKNPDGSKTYYVTSSNKGGRQVKHDTTAPLLLLHGIGANHAMWSPQIEIYAESGFHVLVPDLFGHGYSSKLNPIRLDDWHRQVNWLLSHHGIAKCTIIGVSMGGVIAQSYTVEYPHRVNKLIIVDSFGELRTLTEKLLAYSQIIGFNLLKLLGNQLLANGMHSVYRKSYAKAAQTYFEKASLTVDFDQLILARQAINCINVLEQLQKIVIPALVIVGADMGPSFITINQKIAKALPNSQFVILEQSMDPSNLVNPTGFNHQVLKFLALK